MMKKGGDPKKHITQINITHHVKNSYLKLKEAPYWHKGTKILYIFHE